MHNGKSEILRDLDPSDPASIQALIDFHRETFGGWVMEGDDGQGKPDDPPAGDGAKPDGKGGEPKDGQPDDKPLGPNGEKALKAEREAREDIEKQLNQLKAGLASALGVKDGDAKSSTDHIVATLQQQMAELQRGNLVLSVASENKITDKDDLALLGDYKGDADGLRKLAARLKPSDDQPADQPTRKRTPAPDHSQGQGGSQKLSGREEGLAQARKRFPQPAK